MLSLERVLIDYDLGLLRVIAELWGVELSIHKQREAAEQLAAHMLTEAHLLEIVSALPPGARAALDEVRLEREARAPLARFTRVHGELRAMGPARREREQPWQNAPSFSEVLWYRGLTARAFFDTGGAPQEYIFIPEDLRARLAALPALAVTATTAPLVSEATAPVQISRLAQPRPRCTCADDATTVLAYTQILPLKPEEVASPKARASVRRFLHAPEALACVVHLALELHLLSGPPYKPDAAHARPFLEQTRLAQAHALAEAWRASATWNDLRQLPGLIFEGQAWHNDPVAAREAILTLLADVPPGQWWSLDSFVMAVKERSPDFQRPAGDYDSWYIRDSANQAYLRGFTHWERIDGALVRYLIQQPLHWLGLVDVAVEEPGANAPADKGKGSGVAFRLTPEGAAFLRRAAWPPAEAAEPATGAITPDGLLTVPTACTPYDRFRLARITRWVELKDNVYSYRITPSSLKRAVKQGVSVSRILAFLQQWLGKAPVPPLLVGAIQRWARSGAEAMIKETFVLKLGRPELLELLQNTPLIGKFLGRPLGPAAVEVRREDAEQLRAALAELGILSD